MLLVRLREKEGRLMNDAVAVHESANNRTNLVANADGKNFAKALRAGLISNEKYRILQSVGLTKRLSEPGCWSEPLVSGK
jgi:hypothetical protein